MNNGKPLGNMKHPLDHMEAIRKLDTMDVLGSIEQLGNQCQQAWDEVNQISFSEKYKHVKNIVFSGMGGSNLGAYVVKSLLLDRLNLPFEIIHDYNLPAFVCENTLIVLSTYSGTTEEVLSCAQKALEKQTCIIGMTTGGKLKQFLSENRISSYIYTPNYNPCNQPRLAIGYSVFGLLAILDKLGLIDVSDSTLESTISSLNQGNNSYGVKQKLQKNKAKQLAMKWQQKIPIIVASEFLTNVGRVIRNHLHESSKSFAAFHEIPELNHHLMESLKNPFENENLLNFLFINSSLYSSRIAKRFKVTMDVVKQNKITIDDFIPLSLDKIAQAMESIQFGAYVSFYLAMLYNIDPTPIPWVDYFKAQLSS